MSKKPEGNRLPDHPEYKEQIMSQLFGEFIGFLKTKGLTQGKDFEIQIREVFQCSNKIIWIDEYDKDYQITMHLNSIQMFIEFGYVKKLDMSVLYREKIENLRYKISTDTKLELIDNHRVKYDNFFKSFEKYFNKLKSN